jgi:hypothetical protein
MHGDDKKSPLSVRFLAANPFFHRKCVHNDIRIFIPFSLAPQIGFPCCASAAAVPDARPLKPSLQSHKMIKAQRCVCVCLCSVKARRN